MLLAVAAMMGISFVSCENDTTEPQGEKTGTTVEYDDEEDLP